MKHIFIVVIFCQFIYGVEKRNYLFQSLEFEYQYIENNFYYKNGEINNMNENLTMDRDSNSLNLNYLIRSRTGYSYWFFTTYLEYLFSINQNNQYNNFDAKIDDDSTSVNVHEITPQVYFHYDPFGLELGINYLTRINREEPIGQVWSLRPNDSLAFLFKFYWPQFWSVPLGVSLSYEIAFRLALDAADDLYQRGSFGFYINFSYYSQFQVLYTVVNSKKDQTITRVINDFSNEDFFLPQTNRYYLDFILVLQITDFLALKLGMGQLLYSEFESPMLRFNVGMNFILPFN